MFDRPQHKLFRSECLSVVTENLSVRSEHKLFRSERLSVVTENLSVRSERNLFRSERLFVRSEHNLFRSERLCFRHHNLSKAYQSSCFVQNACLSIATLMRSLTTLKQSLSIKLFRY
ncbi:MAG: hypothetical protein KME50_18805 [Nostoc desertorum CM1-VF14]|nr:hypothetical protein [Nostoc desertorum CM1-VF14]